jgi:hypothetical protein
MLNSIWLSCACLGVCVHGNEEGMEAGASWQQEHALLNLPPFPSLLQTIFHNIRIPLPYHLAVPTLFITAILLDETS